MTGKTKSNKEIYWRCIETVKKISDALGVSLDDLMK